MSTEQQAEKKPKRANAEGSIFLWKGRGWYVAVTGPDGRRIQRKAPRQTEKGAEALLRSLLRQRDSGELTRGSITLAEFKEEWLRAAKLRGCKPRTLQVYREKITVHVEPTLGRVSLQKLTPVQIERLYAKKLEGGLSPASIRMVHLCLHNMLKLAKRRRLIGHIATELVDPPKVPKFEARALSVRELRIVYRTMAGHKHGPFWTFIAETGCRFTEAANVRRSDVDRERMTVKIHVSKTDAGRREVPLTRRMLIALDEQDRRVEVMCLVAGDRWEDHDLIFPNRRGRPLREDHVITAWHEMLKATELEGDGKRPIRMHDLRHSKGTVMADQGEDLVVIQRTLGHAKSSITADLYIGKVPTALRGAADRWDALLGADDEAPEPVP